MALCSVWIRGEKGTVRWDQISVRQAALDLNIWVVHERFRRRLTRSRSQVPTFRCNLTDYRNCPASIYTIIYGFVVYKVMYSRSTTLYVFGVIFFSFLREGGTIVYIRLRGHPFSVAQIKVKLRSYFALAFAGVLTGQLSEYSLNLSKCSWKLQMLLWF